MSADPKTYYDKLVYNDLHFKKKRGGQHDVGLEIEGVIPAAGEIRLLGNRHRQCAYYRIGVEVCHTQMMKDKAESLNICFTNQKMVKGKRAVTNLQAQYFMSAQEKTEPTWYSQHIPCSGADAYNTGLQTLVK